MTASHVNEFHGNPQIVEQCKEQIIALLKFMKKIPQFSSYFVKDLLMRASMTLEKAATEDFKDLGNFSIRNLRKAMDGSPLLDPLNLLFLREQVFDLELIEDEQIPEMIKAFFDLHMSYAIVFKRQDDYFICLDILKMAKKTISLFDTHLAKFVGKESLLEGLFSSKLLQCLTINMDCEGDSLTDRKKIVLEIIVKILKLQERFKDEHNKEIPIGFENSQSVTKALSIFKTIEEGNKFTSLIGAQKFWAILQGSDAKKI